VPIAFAMPVQWNAYKKAGGNSSATIFSSNNVRQAVMLSTTYVMDRDKKALRNAKFYWATLLCFHTGVAAACLLSIFFAAQSVWFCFVLIGISVIAYYRYESAKIKAFSDI
ncbi:MAG: YoaK family protein, partial [Ruminococcus sp.]|nr:YoaK family protein [Ruminococcus sp.]